MFYQGFGYSGIYFFRPEGGIEVAYELLRHTGDLKYLEFAFDFAEKSKSNLLYHNLSEHHAIISSGLPDSALAYGATLKAKISYIISQMEYDSINAYGMGISTYDNELFNLKRKHDDYLRQLESNYPLYYQLKYGHQFLDLTQVQTKLNNQVLIEYALTPESIFIFVVRGQDTQLIQIDKPDNLDNHINDFRQAILSRQHHNYEKLGYQLYSLLFDPIQSLLKQDDHLIIVPDGNLWYLNFDLLLKEKASNKPFYDLPYLIRDYTISYANSANLLLMNKKPPSEQTFSDQCLAFSYSDGSNTTSSSVDFSVLRNLEDDLPGTREEIKSISKLLPGKYYFGSQASESNFKKESQSYSILHLALHGEIDNENPLYSKLHFSKSVADSIEDGQLNTYEIYNMSLNSKMAVLSACNTGNGKLEKGEGLMSLGRAFQHAGVSSLLITSWEVPDQEAPKLMYNFYNYINQGFDKATALRKAKLDFLTEAGMYKSAPFYWGSYVVIGDPSALSLQSETNDYWKYLIIILLIGASAVIYINRNRLVKLKIHKFRMD